MADSALTTVANDFSEAVDLSLTRIGAEPKKIKKEEAKRQRRGGKTAGRGRLQKASQKSSGKAKSKRHSADVVEQVA